MPRFFVAMVQLINGEIVSKTTDWGCLSINLNILINALTLQTLCQNYFDTFLNPFYLGTGSCRSATVRAGSTGYKRPRVGFHSHFPRFLSDPLITKCTKSLENHRERNELINTFFQLTESFVDTTVNSSPFLYLWIFKLSKAEEFFSVLSWKSLHLNRDCVALKTKLWD